MAQRQRDFTEVIRREGASLATLVLAGILATLFRDTHLIEALVGLFVGLVLAIMWWIFLSRRAFVVLVAIFVVAIGWGYVLWRSSQPTFEINALDTLDGDKNAYELTDMLIWSQDEDEQDEYGVSVEFPIEVLPRYHGPRTYGRVIARISGFGETEPLKKPLWDDFRNDARTKKFSLTLPELVEVSGLQLNSDPPSNLLGPGDLYFQRANLVVEIVREADPTKPLGRQEIVIRNAPWEFRSDLVWRDGRHQVDVYVRNLGGAGGFRCYYRLVLGQSGIDG